MHVRKQTMFDRADAFVALPGGIGTLEELVEQLTWAQLGRHKKPILILNIKKFWDPLCALLDHMRRLEFIRADLAVALLSRRPAGRHPAEAAPGRGRREREREARQARNRRTDVIRAAMQEGPHRVLPRLAVLALVVVALGLPINNLYVFSLLAAAVLVAFTGSVARSGARWARRDRADAAGRRRARVPAGTADRGRA